MTAGPDGSALPSPKAGPASAVVAVVGRLASVAAIGIALLAGAPFAGAAQPSSRAAGGGAAAAAASPYAARYAENCAACHGADGRSDQPGVPVLSGQHAFYVITQLFMFREGRRADPGMSAVAKGMKDDDMRGYSQFIATLAPSPAPAPAAPPDPERMKRGEALAREHKCVFCHGADFSGGQQVPRIADQHEDYLRMTLREFREGKRPGYTMAMTEAVGQIRMEDLDTLAYYVAHLRAPALAR